MTVRIGSVPDSESDVRSRLPRTYITNVLTKQFTYASQSGCLPKRTGAYGTSCWSRLICGGDEKRQEDDRLANEVFAFVHDIASECLPDERTAR